MNEHPDRGQPTPDRRTFTDEDDHHEEVLRRLAVAGHLVRLEHDAHQLLNTCPALERPLRVQLLHLIRCAPQTAEQLVAPLLNGDQ